MKVTNVTGDGAAVANEVEVVKGQEVVMQWNGAKYLLPLSKHEGGEML